MFCKKDILEAEKVISAWEQYQKEIYEKNFGPDPQDRNQSSKVLIDEELEELRVKNEIQKKERMKKMTKLDQIKNWFSLHLDDDPVIVNFKSDVHYFDFVSRVIYKLMEEQSVERIVFNNVVMKSPVGDLLLNVKEFNMKLCLQNNGDTVILTNKSGLWERIYAKHVKCEFTRQSFLNIMASTMKYTIEQIMKGDYSNIQFIINEQSKE